MTLEPIQALLVMGVIAAVFFAATKAVALLNWAVTAVAVPLYVAVKVFIWPDKVAHEVEQVESVDDDEPLWSADHEYDWFMPPDDKPGRQFVLSLD